MHPALPAARPEPATIGVAASPHWGPVLALAGLHGAVTLAWVVYNLYLGALLLRAGFEAFLVPVLLTVEGLVGAVIEPLTGALSDRARRGLFRRFFLLTGGVLLAGVIFIALPLAAAGGRPGPASLVPALLVAWAVAMAVFRAPALSLLRRHARPGSLPLAAAVLTTAGALVGALAPSVRGWLLAQGPLVTFAGASAALLVAALVVRALESRSPPSPVAQAPRASAADRAEKRAAWALFGVGTGAGLGLRFLLDGLPRAGAGPGASAADLTRMLFLGTALAAIPLGRLALGRIGGGPVTAGGLALLVVGAALAPQLDGAGAVLACAALLGAAVAAAQTGLFATSLSAVPATRAGLGMGLLLGGGGLALSVFNAVLAVRKPAPSSSLLAAAGCYALSLLLLGGIRRELRADVPG
jgi:hypothetical protein